MNPYLKLMMEKPGQIPERGSSKTKRWMRKARRYGRLLKREGRRRQAEIERMNSEGFYVQVYGTSVHISADPDMNEKTLDALMELVKAAIRAMENGEIGEEDEGS